MRKLLHLLVCLMFLVSSCVSLPAVERPQTRNHLLNSVVLLLEEGESPGELGPVCAGTFITEKRILTAAHCVRREGPVIEIEILPGLILQIPTEPEEPDPTGDIVQIASRHQYLMADGDFEFIEHTSFVVIGWDEKRDLALLQLEEGEEVDYRPEVVSVYSGIRPRIGDQVVAIGHPVGLTYTVTTGRISRDEERYEDVLHLFSSADIYFGNSGGPLFDSEGRLIGVASWIMAEQSHLGGWVAYQEVHDFLSEYSY